MEEKENALRCLRQKMSAEKEKEERSLREEAERSRQELVQQLEKEKVCVQSICVVVTPR